jgi:transposase
MMTEHKAITEPVRRLEVFTGAGRRRTWSTEDKARIVAESLMGEESVCAVARRHGLSPQQLFGWRRQLRQMAEGAEPQAPQFVPAVIEAPAPERPRKRMKPRGRGDGGDAVGVIEVEIAGVTVRVGRGVEAKTVAAVLRALKGGA